MGWQAKEHFEIQELKVLRNKHVSSREDFERQYGDKCASLHEFSAERGREGHACAVCALHAGEVAMLLRVRSALLLRLSTSTASWLRGSVDSADGGGVVHEGRLWKVDPPLYDYVTKVRSLA